MVKIASQIRDLLRIQVEDEPLLKAQLAAMERQIPLLYIISLTSVWAVGLHFYGTAPLYLSLYLPIAMSVMVAIRMYGWVHRVPVVDPAIVIRKLKALVVLSVGLTVILSVWGWMLDGYANDLRRSHLAFFVAVILVSAAFALAQFPPAAISSISIGGLAFSSYCISTGHVVYMVLGVNFAVVLGVIAVLLVTFNKAFVQSVHAQDTMTRANDDMARMNALLIYHRDNLAIEVRRRTAELEAQAVMLEKALSQEKELNQMQNQFVSMVSHEFRTPLTVIDATARRVERRSDVMPSQEISERMVRIRSSVKRLSGLVERTLDASRLANGAIDYNPVRFDVRQMIDDIIERQMEETPDAVINLMTDRLPDMMSGDPNLIDHMFSNIVSNAVKYSQDNPFIEVSVKGEDDRLVFTVRDQGVGIPKDELARVTERFYRASTSGGIPGTGIGLNFVSSLVKMHNGCLCIDSEEGAWTEVSINLPLDGVTVKPVCGASCEPEQVTRTA